jgi:hypothetical protein
MASRSFARLVLAALIPLSLGCGDPIGPLDLAGTYILENPDTAPLSPDAPPGTRRVLADTILLRFTQTGTRSSTFQYVEFNGGIELASFRQPLEFSVDGERLLITPQCPAAVACLDVLRTQVAHRTAAGFRMMPWDREGEELHYVKVD